MLRIEEKEALTFDDVLLVPAYSEVLPKDVSVQSRLTKNLKLNIPILSAAMDTVTESQMAITMAQEGGVGVLHKNMTPEAHALEVRRVKKFESGVVSDPLTISSKSKISELLDLTRRNNISGVPVVDDNELVGIVTSRDMRFQIDHNASVETIMTQKEKLVTVKEGFDRASVKNILHEHRIEKVLVVDEAFRLKGMVTVKDIQKAETFPHACKDDQGRLVVGAAVGTGHDTERRIELLVGAGVDFVVVDTAHGHSKGVIDQVAWVKKNYPKLEVIGGNIATGDAAKALADVGVDAVKVGIGPGSICTTRIVAGIGVPQITAISNVRQAMEPYGVPVIADGGIRFSGDIAKAIVAGADSIMVGSLLAGTEEAPGEVELYQGRYYKAYRGMGSLGAMSQSDGSSDRYFQDAAVGVEKLVPEGIEGRVPYKGPVSTIVHQMLGGLRSSMGYTGSADLHTMQTRPKFIRTTTAGMTESHVHDVSITKEAPNYRLT